MEDSVDLLGNGHLDAVARGEAECGCSGANSFGDLASHAGEDVVKLASAAKLDPDGAVARESSGAGEHEVADAGETGDCLASTSAGDGEARHLGDAACDECGGRVVAEVESFDDAGGEGDDVLECAAELDSGDVVVGVDAQRGRGEVALDGLGDSWIMCGGHDNGGTATCDLLCEGRAGEHGAGNVGDGGDDL